jgi:hypothetical protein
MMRNSLPRLRESIFREEGFLMALTKHPSTKVVMVMVVLVADAKGF